MIWLSRLILLSAPLVGGHSLQSVLPSSFESSDEDIPQAQSRGLQGGYELIAGYQPRSLVTDQNALDMDLQTMQGLLASGTTLDNLQAREIYYRGAFSNAVATLNLTVAVTSKVPKGTIIIGKNSGNTEVRGTVYQNCNIGSRRLYVQYDVSANQESYMQCRAGANPNPVTDGCFASASKIIIDDYGQVNYSYDMLEENSFRRTIRGLSEKAPDEMYLCPTCPYTEYDKFYHYYGKYAYADNWVISAFNGGVTPFDHGNADFQAYDYAGRAEAIQRGIVCLSFWMYVVRKLEEGLDNCHEDCIATTSCTNQDAVHAWDEAVAYYTGSLEGQEGSGPGVLLYHIADKQCQKMSTCGEVGREPSGTAYVNQKLHSQFAMGQAQLLLGKCQFARAIKERIVTLMTIPLIQGTILSAYARTQALIDSSADTKKVEAEGAAFAAGILPLVHACSPEDAAIIHDNTQAGLKGTSDFSAVKQALERQYKCLGVTCADIGGIYDSLNGGFMDTAEPCQDKKKTQAQLAFNDEPMSPGLIVAFAVGAPVFMAILVFVSTFFGPHPPAATTPTVGLAPATDTTQNAAELL